MPMPPPPPMVLVDRSVVFVDELDEVIKELGGLPLRESMNSVLRDIPPSLSDDELREWRYTAREKVRARHAKLEEEAFDILIQRKATTHPSAARKEPLLPEVDASIYARLLCGVDPCLSSDHPVADPPSVTRLSLKISWPPGFRGGDYDPSSAFISSCHRCFLVLYVGDYRPGIYKAGFYLVYNAWANSAAIVPPLFHVFGTSHCRIGPAGVVLLCCGKEGDYVLAELLLRRDVRSTLPTNKATLFIWESSSSGQWIEREVLLPIPVSAPPAGAVADDERDSTTVTTFCADMAFAVSFSSICWVDLLTGILVYNHIHNGQFHFISLPEECASTGMTRQCSVKPDEYRSMCCIDRQTLKLVSMDMCNQERPNADLMIRTWTLRRPLSPTNWKWDKDVVLSNYRVRDLWDDPVYKGMLNRLWPIWPSYPVISTQEPHIIYLSINDFNTLEDLPLFGGIYVLSLNLRTCRVESVYKIPCGENEIIPRPRLFTSDFSRYLNKTREWDMVHGKRDYLFEVPRWTECADEGELKSNRSTPYTVGVGLGMLKLSRGGVITTHGTALRPSSRKTGALTSSSRLVGLQAALDFAMTEAATAEFPIAEAA